MRSAAPPLKPSTDARPPRADALECARLELQMSSAALAVAVRALRRSQQINSELRASGAAQNPAGAVGSGDFDVIAAAAEELASIPSFPAAAALLPVVMEQAIRETDAFNRAFYDASMSAPQRPETPDLSMFSQQSSPRAGDSPRSQSAASPAAFGNVFGDKDAAAFDPAPLPPMQLYMWDSILWPIVSAKVDAIAAAKCIFEDLLNFVDQTCNSRPYPSSNCITLPFWIDTDEHSALSTQIITQVLQPLQALVVMAGLDIQVIGPLGSAWGRNAAGSNSADSDGFDAFWSKCLNWGTLPVSHLVASTAEPASVCVSVIGQRLIQPIPFNSCALGLIRRYNLVSVPTSYHEACIVALPSQMPIVIPRLSLVMSSQENSELGLLQRKLLRGSIHISDPKYSDESQLAAAAAAGSSDWSLQQSPLQWLAAFQFKRRILLASEPKIDKSEDKHDLEHSVITCVGQGNIIAALQKHLTQQILVWFPSLRQAAESISATCKSGIQSTILRQMYKQHFMLFSDPFAFHRSISQLHFEHLPSQIPTQRQIYWVSCKSFTGSSGFQCCDQSWFKNGREEIAKTPLLRTYPVSVLESGASSIAQSCSWQLMTTQLLLCSLSVCYGREVQLSQVIEWFRSLSSSLTTRSIVHSTVAVVYGLKGSGKTTLVTVSHRVFSNAIGNSTPVEIVFLCDEVMQQPATSVDEYWPNLAFHIVCALVDHGLAAANVADVPSAISVLTDIAKEACSKRAVAVVIDVSLTKFCALMSKIPPSGFRLPQLPGFMIIFTISAQLLSQTPIYCDAESAKLKTVCEETQVPFVELPMLDAKATLALADNEISRYYHVAGHMQPPDAVALSSSLHQFIQNVPIMGGHPLWIKTACRCACVNPDEWYTRLSEHVSRISSLVSTSKPMMESSAKSSKTSIVSHPPTNAFKPNLASSLAATAARWKRDGFNLFEKSSSNAVRSSASGSLTASNNDMQAAQDTTNRKSAEAICASSGSDHCEFILRDLFDIFIDMTAASLNLDKISNVVDDESFKSSSTHKVSSSASLSRMLHLATSGKCPVPLHCLCAASKTTPAFAACISWFLHEVVLLNSAGCIFILRHTLIPTLPSSFNHTAACFSLSVELGHSVSAWTSAVEGAFVADEDFFRTQPANISTLDPHLSSPKKNAGSAFVPLESFWFKQFSRAFDSKSHDENGLVLNSSYRSAFAIYSLLNCLAFARLGGLLQQWLMTPACAMLLGGSEVSRYAARCLWVQSHELGSLSPASALMTEAKRTKASAASSPALLSLFAIAHNYRLLQMNDEASDIFDAAASMSTRLFGNTCALSCRLLICAAMCHRLAKRYVAAKERLSAACWACAQGATGRDSSIMAAAVEIQGIVERDQGTFDRSMQLLQGAVSLKESVAYGRLLLQSLYSTERSMPHVARYAVLFANSLGAEPVLSADVLGVSHLLERAGSNKELLHAISGLVVEAACALCIQTAAEISGKGLGISNADAFESASLNLRDRDSTVEQLLSAAIVIAGSGSKGIVDHDAAAGIAMLALSVRVSRVDSRRSEAITIAERGQNVLLAALGAQHPSTSNASDLVAKLRGSLQLRVPTWLIHDSIWRL